MEHGVQAGQEGSVDVARLPLLAMSLFAGDERRSSPPSEPPPASTGHAAVSPVPVPHFLCHLVPSNKSSGITFSSRGSGTFPSAGETRCYLLLLAPATLAGTLPRNPEADPPSQHT